jgi:pimeloyl-ACP methyl ester carboxylesterase
MSPWRGRAALVAALAFVAACSGSGSGSDGGASEGAGPAAGSQATSSPDLAPIAGGDFYEVPDPLPEGDHGTLIRYQPVDDLDVAGASAWRIMYLSEDLVGDPIAVTGTALVPSTAAPEAGRPVLTIAHGTTGIADQCAPSTGPERSELALMGPAVEAGYLVAMSDYEGLGTPGRHPYLVGESEGRGVLDAARAAGQLPDADPGERMAIFGYSQGGHGALWAGQLAAEWTPELDVVGTVAGAPATELPVIVRAAGSLPISGFLYMIIAGFNDAYPDEAPLSAVLTPEGEARLSVVDQACVGEVIRQFAGSDSSALLVPGGLTSGAWAALAEENDPGRAATEAPVLILHSAADATVPAALSQLLADRMCDAGQVVERRVYDRGQSHVDAVPDAVNDGLAWIDQRLAGEEPVSTCPSG